MASWECCFLQCICPSGTRYNSIVNVCEDINECLEMGPDACVNGKCTNSLGSFECECPKESILDNTGRICLGKKIFRELFLIVKVEHHEHILRENWKSSVYPKSAQKSENHHLNNLIFKFCVDNRKGSCWTKVTAGRCENNLPRFTLKSECCCSVGLAWGSPCELCHTEECSCAKGFAKVIPLHTWTSTINFF